MSLRTRSLLTVGLLLLCAFNARATVSISLGADTLKTSAGAPMSVNGMVLLVASTTDSVFTPPTAGAFVTNDDIIVARFDLSSTATPGQINTIISGIALSGNWNASDALAIYWYPTLGTNATVPGAGTSYGFYRDPVANGGTGTGTDGSDAWFTPADGSLVNLYFFTGDAGSCCNSSASGNASSVVPSANNLPVANANTFTRIGNTSIKIKISDLLTNDTDADIADTVTFVSVVSPSTDNATVTANTTNVLYSNINPVNDQFSYVITDGHPGVSVTGLVYINIVGGTGTSSVVSLQTGFPAPGTNTISFAGIPGYNYIAQYSTNIAGPWAPFSTNDAGTNGQWVVVDRTATNASRFYRTIY